MDKTLYLSIACDADPDINPSYRELSRAQDKEENWQGYVVGVPALRRRLQSCRFSRKHGDLPVTWMLRSDRQIYEMYGDAAFCFRQFEPLWKKEVAQGSEIGWHPHLYRWDERHRDWKPYLGLDDDLEILSASLSSFRQVTDVRAVRTGWNYHSNKLLRFFNDSGITVDASASSGCVNSRTGPGQYDWAGAPRIPYHPSPADYRRPPTQGEQGLNILVLPVLVRKLKLPVHLGRYFLRTARAIRSGHTDITHWENARWQGILITTNCEAFYEATEQTLTECLVGRRVFLTTYFHTDELLSPQLLEVFARNLDSIVDLAERFGYTIVPCTLSSARSMAISAGSSTKAVILRSGRYL